MSALTTGQVARQADVNVETIRFYERKGLLEKPPRRPSGYRQYGPEAVRRVQFIKGAQALGFTLSEISDLLSLKVELDAPCAEVCELAESKISTIEEKIVTLQRMKRVLKRLTTDCKDRQASDGCPILETLEPAPTEDEAAGAIR